MLIEGYSNNFSIELGTGEWATNLAAVGVGTLLTGGVSLIGSGLAAGWSKKIEGDIWNFIEQKVIFGERAKSNREIAVIKTQESLEEKLRQLKEVFEQNLIDEVTYNSKKKELENQAIDQKKNNELNEKLMKLKNALDTGILSQIEYETKKSELMTQTSNADLENKLAQLKAALATGILSQEEFNKKAADIKREISFSEKLKQLEGARNSGILTNEEFEQKKSQILATNI
ncbi:SHOCT domain-containing protein [Dendronalium sp. ChiSLP03b]|uniref:SHOCT domain-containing protein n=1 Tax=Dendronalium sp. ChiSLP03b TaxID=3075381 RepID=UPI002AD4A9E5|nr:SHOCT domain-containing protein [Dendronalium sp. ChiSLP03b]MDZ8208553.1 SHOCT domain-containing protein [Dendronalium sp. ChiSLP03b]